MEGDFNPSQQYYSVVEGEGILKRAWARQRSLERYVKS